MLDLLFALLRLCVGAALGAGLAVVLAVLGYSLVSPPGSNKDDATGLGAVLLAIVAAPPGALFGALVGLRLGRKAPRVARDQASVDDWTVPDAERVARIISHAPEGRVPPGSADPGP